MALSKEVKPQNLLRRVLSPPLELREVDGEADEDLKQKAFGTTRAKQSSKSKSRSPPPVPRAAALFDIEVRNLDPSLEEADVEELFKPFGKLAMVRLRRDAQGQSLGFAFLRFREKEDALKAAAMHLKEVKGRKLWVGLGRRDDGLSWSSRWFQVRGLNLEVNQKTEEGREAAITLSNLDPNIKDSEVRLLCERFGRVCSVKILKDEVKVFKEFKGLGTVTAVVGFEYLGEATEAMNTMDGEVINGRQVSAITYYDGMEEWSEINSEEELSDSEAEEEGGKEKEEELSHPDPNDLLKLDRIFRQILAEREALGDKRLDAKTIDAHLPAPFSKLKRAVRECFQAFRGPPSRGRQKGKKSKSSSSSSACSSKEVPAPTNEDLGSHLVKLWDAIVDVHQLASTDEELGDEVFRPDFEFRKRAPTDAQGAFEAYGAEERQAFSRLFTEEVQEATDAAAEKLNRALARCMLFKPRVSHEQAAGPVRKALLDLSASCLHEQQSLRVVRGEQQDFTLSFPIRQLLLTAELLAREVEGKLQS